MMATFNFNVGVLGHVDSGKTSLSKALSTIESTASFDKNPQSRERGITLDLGFSSFSIDVPDHLKPAAPQCQRLQYTLVDCPGHASLIRTIIGGAQIIDLMMLVVDITKGMQTQTAECLVIGEITCDHMIIVLNKVDLIPQEKREAQVEKMKKRMHKTLESTKFQGCPICAVAAKPGGSEGDGSEGLDLSKLISVLSDNTYLPKRENSGPFVFAVDHCFSIKGQGTVMTGTTLSGSMSVSDTIEIPSMKVTKKVKSIQMFKKPVDTINQGDRAGICVTQFDPKLLERGLVCSPSALPTICGGIVSVEKIGYYKGPVNSKAKFHVTSGHETVMGRVSFFGLYEGAPANVNDEFNFNLDYVYQEQLIGKLSSDAESGHVHPVRQYAVIEYERPVTCPEHCLVIGSKLDTDIHANMCRLAFHGQLLVGFTDTQHQQTILPKVHVYKTKVREGVVERCSDEYTIIGKNLFKKETNIQSFAGLKVALSSGEQGLIEGSFGQSGKVKIRIPEGIKPETYQKYSGGSKKKAKAEETPSDHQPIKISLTFKRYMYDPNKRMKQT